MVCAYFVTIWVRYSGGTTRLTRPKPRAVAASMVCPTGASPKLNTHTVSSPSTAMPHGSVRPPPVNGAPGYGSWVSMANAVMDGFSACLYRFARTSRPLCDAYSGPLKRQLSEQLLQDAYRSRWKVFVREKVTADL